MTIALAPVGVPTRANLPFPVPVAWVEPGFTISFFGRIPVIGGNGIPFRNFGEFRRISVDFGRNLLNFEF